MNADNTYRSYAVTAANQELPVTLERARQQLRNEDLGYDDDYLRGLIRTAGDYVERTYGVALLTQTVKQWHSQFPCSDSTPLMLRLTPLISVTSIQYTDSDGTVQTWSSSEYTTGTFNNRPFITPKINYTWPSDVTTHLPTPIVITMQMGYGNVPSTIPHIVTQAMLLHITDLYENRSDPARTMTTASDRLLLPLYSFSC